MEKNKKRDIKSKEVKTYSYEEYKKTFQPNQVVSIRSKTARGISRIHRGLTSFRDTLI